ncbi:transposase [Ochrobactrum soli]|uniref:Transposase n=1 Tax=Ochrobactrum soli TaxID=2448455 RepID=A0A849KU32_9HYPH|nr:transposase [[Ochrobactrum] soli]NNU63357.1 transposase [[Ochrobactrum] soli]
MATITCVDADWQALISNLSALIDLDATARSSGALVRRRCLGDGATLLRLALAYGPGGMSLRTAAAWAGLNDVATLSDVALLKRLRGSAAWLGDIAGALLLNASGARRSTHARRLRLVDGTSISQPASKGTDFRLHATYEPAFARFTHLELTDVHGGEAFSRVPLNKGDIVVGDRAYARAPALESVIASEADFIVRIGWTSIRLLTLDGKILDWEAIYAPLLPNEICEIDVLAEHSGPRLKGRGTPLFQARLIVQRKDAQATEQAVKAVKRGHQKRKYRQTMQPMTITSAGFLMVLTTVPASEMTAADVLDTYRLRWQVEIAFKRLKSGLGIHKLPAKDPRLSRTWLMAHLIMALIIDEAVTDALDSPPCEDKTAFWCSVPVEAS